MFAQRLGAFGLTATIGILGGAPLVKQCAPPPPPPVISAPMNVADEVIAIVNTHRANMGLAPVANEAALYVAATGQSQDQARRATMTHAGSNGSNAGSRMSFAGFAWSAWGENVAAGQTTPDDVMNAWMNSPGHRANILNGAYTSIGVAAVADRNGTIYWTMDLAAH